MLARCFSAVSRARTRPLAWLGGREMTSGLTRTLPLTPLPRRALAVPTSHLARALSSQPADDDADEYKHGYGHVIRGAPYKPGVNVLTNEPPAAYADAIKGKYRWILGKAFSPVHGRFILPEQVLWHERSTRQMRKARARKLKALARRRRREERKRRGHFKRGRPTRSFKRDGLNMKPALYYKLKAKGKTLKI